MRQLNSVVSVCARLEPVAGMTICRFHSEPKMAAYSVRFT